MRRFWLLLAALLFAAGCAVPVSEPGAAPSDDASAADAAAAPTPGDATVARCEERPKPAAPAEWYRDEPVYVGNEMPTSQLQAWAEDKPGFEEVWIDRDHNGWISLGFSEGTEERQNELEREFPGVGVVAVPVDWHAADVAALQERVVDAFADDGASVGKAHGMVQIAFGVLTEERIAAVAERFAGERICVSGGEPAEAPSPGPQPTAGDGWRLLAAERQVGRAYFTDLAADEDAYAALWGEVGPQAERPPVDFERQVVVWFGAVYGSSCPDLRLDDVVIDDERALLYADIVLPDQPVACTADANPYAFVVAVDRDVLPAGPFAIQLGAEDPPGGAPEERTAVETDLSTPGAVPAVGDLHRAGPDATPPPRPNTSGDVIETGYPAPYRFDAACGIEWLGKLNDVAWQRRGGGDDPADLPPAWRDLVAANGALTVEVTIEPGSPPTATAVVYGTEVVYVPGEGSPPPCS